VLHFLDGLGLMGNYAKSIRTHGIDGPALMSLAEHCHTGQALEIQIKYLSIKVGDALKISKALKQLANASSDSSSMIDASGEILQITGRASGRQKGRRPVSNAVINPLSHSASIAGECRSQGLTWSNIALSTSR
jgi:hypothetical protein